MNQARVIYLKPSELAAVTLRGAYKDTVAHAWDQLFSWLEHGAHHEKPGRGYGLAYDDPRQVPADVCRYSAGVHVPKNWQMGDFAFVSRQTFAGGAYLFYRNRGYYSEMGSIISALRDFWVPKNGLCFDPSRPVATFYHDDPRFTRPEERVADLCIPVLGERRAKPRA